MKAKRFIGCVIGFTIANVLVGFVTGDWKDCVHTTAVQGCAVGIYEIVWLS